MSAHTREETAGGTTDAGDRSTVSSARRDLSGWRRAGAAAVAGGLLALVLGRRSPRAVAIATVGGWLSYRLLGRGRGPRRPSGSDADRSQVDAEPSDGVTASGSITVGRPAEELSAVLRDAEQLDRIAGRFAEVTETDGNRHRYTVDGPLDRSLSWEMRLDDDRPGELVRWTTDEGTAVVDSWTAHLGPSSGDRGTMVRLEVDAEPPGGSVGRTVLDRLGPVTDGLVRTVLDRFKSHVETGEIPTIGENPSGRGEGDLV